MKRLVLSAGSIALVLTVLWRVPIRGSEETSTDFTLSSSSSHKILEITFSGGFSSGESVDYKMFGDGRFIKTHHSGSRDHATEVALSRVEMRELIGALVEGNLMNWLDEETKARFVADIGGVPAYKDIGVTKIRISLESYGESGATTKEIYYAFDITMLKILHPDVALQEVHALDAFWKQIGNRFPREVANGS